MMLGFIKYIKYSVPQGSVQGLFLFMCYPGGTPSNLYENVAQSKLCLYVDDISVSISNRDLNSKTKM